ncbi:phage head protein [Testudinibacter aquarius]|nr:phage head protein [Testudinibacter aquarius]TNG87543.1 head completion/stabilization protein [Testudinibacter aquarius]
MDKLKTQVTENAIADEIITNNGFFPDISLLAIRNAMRLDGTVTNERLKSAVIEAMASVNYDLHPFRQRHQGNTLATVEAETVNGESVLIQRYKRAVYCLTVADLTEQYHSYDATNSGRKEASEQTPLIGELRRNARFAISDILGEVRLTAELI